MVHTSIAEVAGENHRKKVQEINIMICYGNASFVEDKKYSH